MKVNLKKCCWLISVIKSITINELEYTKLTSNEIQLLYESYLDLTKYIKKFSLFNKFVTYNLDDTIIEILKKLGIKI